MPRDKDPRYVVTKGRQTGVFDSYKDQVQPSTDRYPSNIHQKFPSQAAAEKAYYDPDGPSSQDGRQWAVNKGRQPGIYDSWPKAAREVLGYPHNDHRRFDDYESAQKWMRETGDTHSPSLGHGHGGSLRSSDFAGGYSKTSSGPSQGIQSGSYSEDSPRTGYAAAQYDYGYDSTYENAGAHDGAGDYEDGGQYDDAGDYEAGEHYDEEGGYQDGGDYGDYGDDGGYEDGGCYDDDGGYDDYSGGGDYGDDEY